MRTKSRVRGSIASRASAGKLRLWRSISSFASAKLQFAAISCHAAANSVGWSSSAAILCHASPS